MSIVKYTNKKTGMVAVYESTSHYDPETKQSRPIRKYLGMEDPETGALIPSSGKRGRKKINESENSTKKSKAVKDYQALYEEQKKICAEMDTRIKRLERENKVLRAGVERLRNAACEILDVKN
ncbi:MAG: hypothetical protein IJT16_07665 [Lachnospiraceae bacterium]|nr:hypothetical protein [Lachnospiraceae bacterium]